MSFMQLFTEYGGWYLIDTTQGVEVIPEEAIGEVPECYLPKTFPEETWDKIKDYIAAWHPDQVYSIEKQTGWCARYSAPGYMDCTEWVGPYDTEEEVVEACKELYGEED